MATGLCFSRAENLENYYFFARMASEEFDLYNQYFKKVSCLLLFKLSSDFAVMSEENYM